MTTTIRERRLHLRPAAVHLGKDDGRQRKFRMTGYTGAVVQRLFGQAVFDLAGMDVPATVPILLGHDESRIVGQADRADRSETSLELRGFVSSVTEDGRHVAALADEGFKWQASIGVEVTRWEELGAEAEAVVNGRKVAGPVSIARQSRLLETSFLPAGADSATSAEVLNLVSGGPPGAALDHQARLAWLQDEELRRAYRGNIRAWFLAARSEGLSQAAAASTAGRSCIRLPAPYRLTARERGRRMALNQLAGRNPWV